MKFSNMTNAIFNINIKKSHMEQSLDKIALSIISRNEDINDQDIEILLAYALKKWQPKNKKITDAESWLRVAVGETGTKNLNCLFYDAINDNTVATNGICLHVAQGDIFGVNNNEERGKGRGNGSCKLIKKTGEVVDCEKKDFFDYSLVTRCSNDDSQALTLEKIEELRDPFTPKRLCYRLEVKEWVKEGRNLTSFLVDSKIWNQSVNFLGTAFTKFYLTTATDNNGIDYVSLFVAKNNFFTVVIAPLNEYRY